jgi:hypothetical protein
LGGLGLGLAKPLHVLDVFLLQQQVVVHSLHSEVAQLTSRRGVDIGELGGGTGSGGLALPASNASGRRWWWLVLGLVLLQGAASELPSGYRFQGRSYLLVLIIASISSRATAHVRLLVALLDCASQ